MSQNGTYVTLPVDADGLQCSRVFPGLWLAREELLAGKLTQVVAGLELGLTSADYQAFHQSLTIS